MQRTYLLLLKKEVSWVVFAIQQALAIEFYCTRIYDIYIYIYIVNVPSFLCSCNFTECSQWSTEPENFHAGVCVKSCSILLFSDRKESRPRLRDWERKTEPSRGSCWNGGRRCGRLEHSCRCSRPMVVSEGQWVMKCLVPWVLDLRASPWLHAAIIYITFFMVLMLGFLLSYLIGTVISLSHH